jgi:hypothetical protein
MTDNKPEEIDDINEMKRLQREGSKYSYDEVCALADRFGAVLEETKPDLGLALCALMSVAASVIHQMEKYGDADADMVLKSAHCILGQQLEGHRRMRRKGGH